MSKKIIVNPGDEFNFLTIIKEIAPQKGRRRFLCECKCGVKTEVNLLNLRSNAVKSCGCLTKIVTTARNFIHGKSKSSEHGIWRTMLSRCSNKNYKAYADYGARGIRVCERWQASFENFLSDMGNRPSSKHSLDRIDNDGIYEPSNCRWATRTEQSNNKRSNRMIEFAGKTMTLSQWAVELCMPYPALLLRIARRKWPIEKALTTPIKCRREVLD